MINDPRSSLTPQEKEHHDIHARFITIPLSILPLLEKDVISAREVLLLGLIDGYCNHSKGLRCFATNKYLAERVGCSVGQLRTMLTRLYSLQLLRAHEEWKEDNYGIKKLTRFLEVSVDPYNLEKLIKDKRKSTRRPPA